MHVKRGTCNLGGGGSESHYPLTGLPAPRLLSGSCPVIQLVLCPTFNMDTAASATHRLPLPGKACGPQESKGPSAASEDLKRTPKKWWDDVDRRFFGSFPRLDTGSGLNCTFVAIWHPMRLLI